MYKNTLFALLLVASSLGACALETDLTGEDPIEAEDYDAEADGEDADTTARWWSGWFSEEDPPYHAPYRYLINGWDCDGSYCDRQRLDARYVGLAQRDSSWTSWFSEEGASSRVCDGDEWVTGAACWGSYCDNLRIECTEVRGRNGSDCRWSGWISEESAPFNAGSGRYIKGVQCNGSYCDNKRFRHCRL